MRLILLLLCLLGCTARSNDKSIPIIAIIDTGYRLNYSPVELKLCKTGHYNFANHTATIGWTISHGTIVGYQIAKTLKDVSYCAIIINVWSHGGINETHLGQAINHAVNEGASYINISITGPAPIVSELEALKRAGRMGVKIFTAAGNDRANLDRECVSYPTCYWLPNVTSVGATVKGKGIRAYYSNYSSHIKTWYPGDLLWQGGIEDGTSFATPLALSAAFLIEHKH